jgi:hypothetical protein
LISNCQTYGLAHSLQLLAESVVVEPVDIGEYNANIERYNAGFGDYDRVLIGLGAEALPGADLSRARRVDKVPELVFPAYHPDLTYLTNSSSIVDGPIGAYHSMLAFVAHGAGRSVSDTLALFNGRIYEACGYFNGWTAARDNLVGYCHQLGFDIALPMRRWGRTGAFMYSVNHPRIHVLYDIARLYLEREGYEPRVCDLTPPDNLAANAVFAVYPEIGDALGVPGAYLFKRPEQYAQIGLRQFVEESFAVYDRYPPGALSAHEIWRAAFERVSAVLNETRAA